MKRPTTQLLSGGGRGGEVCDFEKNFLANFMRNVELSKLGVDGVP